MYVYNSTDRLFEVTLGAKVRHIIYNKYGHVKNDWESFMQSPSNLLLKIVWFFLNNTVCINTTHIRK